MGFLLPDEPLLSLDAYLAQGGGVGLKLARSFGPDGVVDELNASGLRGRGGAGFPAGRKWASVRAGGPEVGDRFVAANGAEGEPGTFKDRALMLANPYQVLEGLAIAAFTVGAIHAYLAIKASYTPQVDALSRAMKEMADAGMLDDIPFTLVTGPDEYLFGEEKAMLEVIEGEDPMPRLFPPYVHGLFTTMPNMGWSPHVDASSDGPAIPSSNPTLATNVETLANVPVILERGAEWHRSLGTARSAGVMICTVVGDTQRAGVAEVELGTPLREVIERIGGGPRGGHEIKAVLSGVANPVLLADRIDTPIGYEELRDAGGGLGSAGFIVYDDTADMIAVARMASRFLYVESCGQCPPCKFGTGAVTTILDTIVANEATIHDLELLLARLQLASDGNRCALPIEAQDVVGSIFERFAEEVAAHVERRAPVPQEVPVPKIVDIADGVAVYDERQVLKQPDWTYADAR